MKRISEKEYTEVCIGARDGWIDDSVDYNNLVDCRCEDWYRTARACLELLKDTKKDNVVKEVQHQLMCAVDSWEKEGSDE